jgi:hypothetical protein
MLAAAKNEKTTRLCFAPIDRRGTRLFHGAAEYRCSILALSAGGAQIRLPHPIDLWSTVTLAIDGIGSLHCRVVWQRGETLALQFVQSANWVNGKLLAAAS